MRCVPDDVDGECHLSHSSAEVDQCIDRTALQPTVNTGKALVTQHFLLTRFNIRHGFDGAEARFRGLDPEWLGPRFDLFADLTVPSVRAQCVDCDWIVLAHPHTPLPFRKQLDDWCAEGLMQVFWTECGDLKEVQDFIRECLRPETQYILTTRLDNDDAIAADFLASVQTAASELPECIVNCGDGLQLAGARVYPHFDRSNAFISRKESRESFKTVLEFRSHADAWREPGFRQLVGRRGWLQTVHSDNVWNSLSAPNWRHPAVLYLLRFPALRRRVWQGGLPVWLEEIVFSFRWSIEQAWKVGRRSEPSATGAGIGKEHGR